MEWEWEGGVTRSPTQVEKEKWINIRRQEKIRNVMKGIGRKEEMAAQESKGEQGESHAG